MEGSSGAHGHYLPIRHRQGTISPGEMVGRGGGGGGGTGGRNGNRKWGGGRAMGRRVPGWGNRCCCEMVKLCGFAQKVQVQSNRNNPPAASAPAPSLPSPPFPILYPSLITLISCLMDIDGIVDDGAIGASDNAVNVLLKVEDNEGAEEDNGQMEPMNEGVNDELGPELGGSATPSMFADVRDSPSSFVCQQCNSQLDTFEEFIQHMRTVHLPFFAGSDNGVASCPTWHHCPLCGMEQPSRREAKLHLAEHYLDMRSTWKCQKCTSKTFAGLQQLRDHLGQCHAHVLYRCAICLEIFTEREELNEHLVYMHSNKEQTFGCVACEIEFDNRLGLELHIGQMHAATGEPGKGPATHINGQSKANFARKPTTMKKESLGTAKSPKMVQFSAPQPSARALKCVVCDVQCASELALDQHRLFEHCKVPQGNRCAVCRAVLCSLEVFVEHSLAHRNPSNELIDCVICRQSVRGDQQLELHGKYHLGIEEEEAERGRMVSRGEGGETSPEAEGQAVAERQGRSTTTTTMVKCQTCKMELASEEYARHLLLHVVVETLQHRAGTPAAQQLNGAGTAEYHCEQCGKRFESFVRLNTHMLEHLRERINKDSRANVEEGGGGESDQRKQRGKTTGESQQKEKGKCCAGSGQPPQQRQKDPIRCDKCKQTFVSRARFIVHRRRHKIGRGVAKCRICDRHFPSIAHLELHKSMHSAKLSKTNVD